MPEQPIELSYEVFPRATDVCEIEGLLRNVVAKCSNPDTAKRVALCLNTLSGIETEALEYGHLKLAIQDWVKARKECQLKSN